MSSASKFIRATAILGVLLATITAVVFMTLGAATHHWNSTPSVHSAYEGSPSATPSSDMPMAAATYVSFDSLGAAAADAEVIVKGRVLSESTQTLNVSEGASRLEDPTYVQCVVVDFKVSRVIKGNVQRNTVIPIVYLAGEKVPGLRKNASSIVFLYSTEDGHYIPVNPSQGVMRLENGKVKADDGTLVKEGTDEEDIVAQVSR